MRIILWLFISTVIILPFECNTLKVKYMSIYIPCHTAWHLLRNIWTKNLSTVKYWLNKLKYLMGITRFTSYFKNKINEYFVLKQEHKTICFRLTEMFWIFLYKMGMIQYCFTENILFFQSYKWVSTYYIIIQMLKPKNHPNAEAQSNLLPNNFLKIPFIPVQNFKVQK